MLLLGRIGARLLFMLQNLKKRNATSPRSKIYCSTSRPRLTVKNKDTCITYPTTAIAKRRPFKARNNVKKPIPSR
ncbi:hypothetical protein M758_UG262600 [Ceratodon purpureus]|uniref:Uncharacterized protein n=1 Tax=Ceratodon purpureus TaxID=3225 RepID=A0A8T0HKR0_CERPU|nr:hypothetical protein KC19_VG006700 [Ceratodon purpureus]KAG0571380.1 hypothetical protein KC19_VG007200 [Ceratodon purpureus]KAG0596525.1 hypothetical protein M758_UG262600 [Ceratodon purpureus]